MSVLVFSFGKGNPSVDIVQKGFGALEKLRRALHESLLTDEIIAQTAAQTEGLQPYVFGVGSIGRKTFRIALQGSVPIQYKTGLRLLQRTLKVALSVDDVLAQDAQ